SSSPARSLAITRSSSTPRRPATSKASALSKPRSWDRCAVWTRALRNRIGGLFHLLVGIHAPESDLLGPAVVALAGDAAPTVVAALDRAEHARFEPGNHGAVRVGCVVDRD